MQTPLYLRPITTNNCNHSCVFCSRDFNCSNIITGMDRDWLLLVMKILKKQAAQWCLFREENHYAILRLEIY